MTDVWDRLSGSYDRQRLLERVPARVGLDMLGVTSAERLLDVGTGTGLVLDELAARVPRPREAAGVDPSAGMLAQVGPLPPNWVVAEADARALPFGSDEFDVAVAAYVLHVLDPPDVPQALLELRRVLRPGGRLVTITPAVPDRGLARPLAQALDVLGRHGPDRFIGLRAFDPRTALTGAGFQLVRARRSLRGYPSLCVLARAP